MNFLYHIKSITVIIYIFLAGMISSCKKFVEIPMPADQLTSEAIFDNDKTAVQAVTGIYSEMINNSMIFSSGHTTFLAGMCADELYNYTPGFEDQYVSNELTPNSEN